MGCFFHCRILRIIMLSLFAPSIYLVMPCVYMRFKHRYTGPEDFEETLWRYTILSCDNKKNTRRYKTQMYFIFFPFCNLDRFCRNVETAIRTRSSHGGFGSGCKLGGRKIVALATCTRKR